MDSGRAKASVLWGATGALSFLILAEGYVLLASEDVSLANLLLAGLAVFCLATIVSYVAEPRLAALAD